MENTKPIVFVVQDNGKYNFTKAIEFGELKTLLPALMQIQLDSTEVSQHLAARLQDYKEEDCILATGDPAAIVLACAWAAYNSAGVVHLLKYDRQTESYYKVRMELP